MSPSARSITFGISSLVTNCDASMNPGEPGWMRSLPDCVSNKGSQPISSSEPEQITRSALRIREIRLGRASMRCASWRAVIAENTDSLSPPSSCASAAHSGSQAKTLSAAAAGHARSAAPSEAKILRTIFMWFASELVRAMRAKTHDVLEEYLVIRLAVPRVVARELQPDAAELARVPVDHGGVPRGVVAAEDRKVGRAARTRVDQPDAGAAGAEPVVPIAHAP